MNAWKLVAIVGMVAGLASATAAQSVEPQTREALVQEAQARRFPTCTVCPDQRRAMIDKAERILNGTPTWHPFFESAYRGGGLALGAGYMQHVNSFNFLDVRAVTAS